jgi:uncharacterized protein (TIGR03437 family)
MCTNRNLLFAAAFCSAFCRTGLAQPATVLEVKVENAVQYVGDSSEFTRFATDPNMSVTAGPKTFGTALVIGDITAVNGKPARGTAVISQRTLNLRTSPTPGLSSADVVRNAISDYALEILQLDGSTVGSLYATGFSGGGAPPGAPQAVTSSNNAVVGGTGVFIGARGQLGAGVPASFRNASVTEDPANRRNLGGGSLPILVHLIPMTRPEIVATGGVPTIWHGDFTPVTPAKPARGGEVLIVRASGLGPTRPGLNPGDLFPADTLQEVVSPVELTLNGQPAEILNKIGWPGSTDYRVDVRVPAGLAMGTVSAQLSVAWISGSAVNIPIQ